MKRGRPRKIESKTEVKVEDLKKIDWRDILLRAAKTFVQAFLAVIIVANEPFTREALTAGLAAGLSALWNTLREVHQATQ